MGRSRLFPFLVIRISSCVFLSSSVSEVSLHSGGSTWCPKVPAKLGMMCSIEPSLHTDLGLTADLMRDGREDLTVMFDLYGPMDLEMI